MRKKTPEKKLEEEEKEEELRVELEQKKKKNLEFFFDIEDIAAWSYRCCHS